MKKYKFTTQILHNPFIKKDPHGALHMPIYENVAFSFDSAEDIALAFERKKAAHTYSRITNPTVENFEQKIRAITDSQGVIALSSGMAAISNVLMAICSSGDNIIASPHLFGNTFSLFTTTLKQWGLNVRFCDLTNPDNIASQVDENTRAVFFETITNPQIEVVDVHAISQLAHQHNLLVVADTTLTPPSAFEAKAFGIDVEVLSSTKYISGGGTSVGGLIIDYGAFDYSKNPHLKEDSKKVGPFALVNKLRRNVYRNLGSCMAPNTAFLQSVGLETLPMRIKASCSNTHRVAEFLEGHEKVKLVNYPGLKSSTFYSIAAKQFNNLTGGLLTFDLPSKEACFKFLNALQLIIRATNLNDNRTLIIHPSSTIFCEYSAEEKHDMNIRDTMIRLSVGIEDIEDLIDDLTQALEVI